MARKRFGYAKLGRIMKLSTKKHGFQGDSEAPNLLRRLALRHPDVEWVMIGKNDNEMEGMPPNVINPWPTDVPRAPWVESGVGRCEWCGGEHGALRLGNRRALDAEQAVIDMAAQLDGMIMHVGQHGVTHYPIPAAESHWADLEPTTVCGEMVGDTSKRPTKPYVWARNYGGATVKALNAFGDATDGQGPVVWIVTDPRNYLKARDIKWPTGYDNVLSQYAFTRTGKHERYQDPRAPGDLGYESFCRPERDGELWFAQHTYRYGGLELMILPDDWRTWGSAQFHERLPVGIASTSFAKGLMSATEPRRSVLIRDYVLSSFPDAEVWGKWDDKSLQDVPPGIVRQNDPSIFPELLNRWRCTLSLPALGSSWTVAKPMQCWAARVMCFMLGRMDDHGFCLPTRRRVAGVPQIAPELYSVRDDWTEDEVTLARWARVETPDEFVRRAKQVTDDPGLWLQLVETQRGLLERRWSEALTETKIERRLGI